MKFAAVLVATFAAMAAATPVDTIPRDLYLSGDAPKSTTSTKGNSCSECASYCTDDSNGAAISAACLIVKCGIQCLLG